MSYIPALQIITQRITLQGNSYIDYPVLVGMVNTAIQDKINYTILSMVNKLYNAQVRQLLNQGYPHILPMDIMGWYEIKTNERGILSLSLGNYTMTYPAAHGWTTIKSLTFDIQTGKLYQLYDLFKPDSNYMQVLSDLISAQIKARNISLISPYKGIKPCSQDYYIADKALVIYYQLVEFTAYANGFPVFPISVYEIENLIKPGAPLDKMLAP
ncbi:DUF3298 and DUF4163 domain-containing protein [Phosphitispora fastidiosa]|uniref:DUF3298 and DUF4163 domain-containing protein n=1 Tax=Phosphitispora fastidiosa TaxID=2837202 RepID=UPI001E2835B2|nr:DUF3298 and DUF4163 domain-containing protein [Phosphitispora fastidiosa]MBU7006905.1 hypothetical protein [Phosphitispora fastidiosa]